ncbi:calpain-7 [Capsaspora owczarzaki ATCC 30864]|uniref:Calpain-7 n=1 Tax=Capsaspora owczarzaki (strain ATCC 30864) TaxID=595528 RepID=A0A0D2VK63_CAPO3|nr:calpain-7 [Capsaspora owczarzaki ATCC 30864]KJE90407.1 calpain-7 [Capsaspora owczarzaki ATCC 30864]|eukprot:XP_004364591.2 calpain-7 [Capsaspora owczarzaki ATCC 30864]
MSLYAAGYAAALMAVRSDTAGQLEEAQRLYIDAAEAMLLDTKRDVDPQRVQAVRQKVKEYADRAEALAALVRRQQQQQQRGSSWSGLASGSGSGSGPARSPVRPVPGGGAVYSTTAAGRASGNAVGVDDAGAGPSEEMGASHASSIDDDAAAGERDEDLLAPVVQPTHHAQSVGVPAAGAAVVGRRSPNSSGGSVAAAAAAGLEKPGTNPAAAVGLTAEEIEVLRSTSYINGKVFPPWTDADARENYYRLTEFVDPDGPLVLSAKQSESFVSWKRASSMSQSPVMIESVSAYSIRQTVVSDCSFVASLAICSEYERKFQKKVITRCIHPQDARGRPVFNANGKYAVRLLINGVARKVVVDDFLPFGRDAKPLCSFSNNPNELWVSIIEKAYMKVMGGYDFPGSNSNIDMFALTGWIPERINMKASEFKPDVQFSRMTNGLRTGDVLMTMSTGALSAAEEERTGLVPSHAYAILDVRYAQGYKLLLVQNPWNHRRWKGAFSELDDTNWTPALLAELRFDRNAARQSDNGVFWINWESVCRFFDVMYLNWDPQLLQRRYTIHSAWPSSGPVKDLYNLEFNPQYRLEVNSPSAKSVVWVLLSKHVVDKADFADNQDFITSHIFESDGGRIYYPDNAIIEGIKINSPHVLAKLTVPAGKHTYTLVLAQYKTNAINYTLKVYASAPFSLLSVGKLYHYQQKLIGNWTQANAGGCGNYSSYFKNPQFSMQVAQPQSSLLLKLMAPKSYPAGIALYRAAVGPDGTERVDTTHGTNMIASAPKFRHGFCYLEVKSLAPGSYIIVPATFEPGRISQFFLTVESITPVQLAPLAEVGEGGNYREVQGEWIAGSSAVGSENSGHYDQNPMYRIWVSGNTPCEMSVRLRLPGNTGGALPPALNIGIFAISPSASSASPGVRPRFLASAKAHTGDYVNPRCGVVLGRVKLDPGAYLLVPSTFDPLASKFILDVTMSPNATVTIDPF